ncbi:MAG: hypothetical protein M1835_007632 [Candelina submexicana]|nr:MAG: hypothetical protein M1835_007632 [Candelina submexicana]
MPKEDAGESPTPGASRSSSVPASTTTSQATSSGTSTTGLSTSSTANKRSQPAHPSESPAKKSSKWSSEEDALIIDLRGGGMKWEDISQRLPGRSALSCRLHYQNYLERRSEWDEERKNKLARLYERLKPDMWSKVAEEMQIPWRAVEAMHWQLGEEDMARRAGVVPFSLSSSAVETLPPPRVRRGSVASARSRRESTGRSMPPQLPPVEEVNASAGDYPTPFQRSYEPRRPSASDPQGEGSRPRR